MILLYELAFMAGQNTTVTAIMSECTQWAGVC